MSPGLLASKRYDGVLVECQAATTAADDDGTVPPDYSQMQVWDKRYKDGVMVEWYCGFDHVRPLFERFIPKVCPID